MASCQIHVRTLRRRANHERHREHTGEDMTRVIAAAIVLATVQAAPRAAGQEPPTTGAVFVAYYWHAKPGQIDAYNEYVRTVAVPIDEDARRAGAFEEVRTVTPAPGTTVEWTHLRIFRVMNADAARGLGPGLDAATARIVPEDRKSVV